MCVRPWRRKEERDKDKGAEVDILREGAISSRIVTSRKHKTGQTVAALLVCLLVSMVKDAMSQRRSSVCWANVPLLLGYSML